MGVVYRARALEHGNREEALKAVSMKKGASDEVVQRFKREIMTASLVEHENVCAVFDAGEAEGIAFMSMELVEGEELRDVITREAPIDPERALGYIEQIVRGLDACHEAHVIHRDLKPENVRVTKKDGREVCKIVDFGIARLVSNDPAVTENVFVTMKGKLSGTPAYVAPELVMEPELVDARADLYAVGIILYELLTGKLPYNAKTIRELLSDSVGSRPIPLEDAIPGKVVPQPYQRVLFKLLEKDQLVRYQSAKATLEAIAEARTAAAPKKKGSRRSGTAAALGAKPEGTGCLGFLFKKK